MENKVLIITHDNILLVPCYINTHLVSSQNTQRTILTWCWTNARKNSAPSAAAEKVHTASTYRQPLGFKGSLSLNSRCKGVAMGKGHLVVSCAPEPADGPL